MNKEQIILIQNKVIDTLEEIREGSVRLSEVGEYFYDYLGDKFIDVLDELLDKIQE